MAMTGLSRAVWLFGAISACASAAAAQSTPAAQAPTPQWAVGPPVRVEFDDWPERALRLEKSGVVVLSCAYDVAGVLGDCEVIKQDPKELGFGLAARAMARKFRLKPMLSDGSALAPGEITFEVRFNIKDVSF